MSPIIGGQAVKGPTAKMMAELGKRVTAATVARHYAGLIDGFVIDHQDGDIEPLTGITVTAATTLMSSLADRESLGREVLAFADTLGRSPGESA